MPADTPRQTLGRRGEDLAADFLRRQGYSIRETNARSRLGEIDIIADTPGDGKSLLVFIEVKTRRGAAFGSPLEAVTKRKQQRLTRLAQAYLQQNPGLSKRVCRFDVIGIVIPHEEEPSIDHIPNAF